MTVDANTPIDGQGLPRLEARLHEDLSLLCWPGKDWVPARTGISDVVIIGGGMCGMVAWMALKTGGIHNVRVLDRSPFGKEGPWMTYARMETLRSPKELTGPAYGHGALTFRAWFLAQFGAAEWDKLDKIPRPMWMDYLQWYRRVLGIPVENGVSVDLVEPEGDLLRLHLSGADEGSILTRKLVFATGRDGTGQPNIPGFVRASTGNSGRTAPTTSTLPRSRASVSPSWAWGPRPWTTPPRRWSTAPPRFAT